MLSGIKAVQTLSRLNRAHPQKGDCVLDFQNNAEVITYAFQDCFRATRLSEETDPNKLPDLKGALDATQVHTPEQTNRVAAGFRVDVQKAVAERIDFLVDTGYRVALYSQSYTSPE